MTDHELSDPSADPAARAHSVPLRGMRKRIARNVFESLQTTAQVTSFYDIDASGLVALRARVRVAHNHAPAIGYNALLVAAVAAALRAEPTVNARIEGNNIVTPSQVDVGFAVALDEAFAFGGGLIVPVVCDADTKSLAEIEAELGDKVDRARSKALLPEEVTGGTFTISNLGSLPGASHWRGATPIATVGQSAILAVGRLRDAIVVGDDRTPTVGSVLPLSLTHDHRLIDGSVAGAFIDAMVRAFTTLGRSTYG